MMCGATENLQTHHWAYGDDELEDEWTITICVPCHQKIHVRHGVGRGVGQSDYPPSLRKTIAIRREVEKALIEAGIEFDTWSEYVNVATMEKIKRR